MFYSSHLFIEAFFNLALVDDSEVVFDFSWNNNILQLILSTPLCPKTTISSLQPFSTSYSALPSAIGILVTPCTDSSSDSSPSRSPINGLHDLGKRAVIKQMPSIRRGRDLPFPAVPAQRRRTLQTFPNLSGGSTLLVRRYSSCPSSSRSTTSGSSLDTPDGGCGLHVTRPRLLRSDSRPVPSGTSTETAEDGGLMRTSRNGTLLRVPPFPLPHRTLQRPTSMIQEKRVITGKKERRPVSKRVSSVPPPLVLEPYYPYSIEDGEDDSPVVEAPGHPPRGRPIHSKIIRISL